MRDIYNFGNTHLHLMTGHKADLVSVLSESMDLIFEGKVYENLFFLRTAEARR